jgi:tRNA-dihydrouridine synthase A
MVTASAILHGDRERLLGFDALEHPVALQLGGDDPAALAAAAAVGAQRGYDEINLNVGCPSDRVQRGRFGACLMAEPAVVAAGVRAMREAVAVPVTVKHRLGIDDLDSDAHLHGFVAALVEAGVDRVVVHARKAWLSGLSPKENRSVPPLQHERVVALKRAFPALRVETNGGVRDLLAVRALLRDVDGVMVGRAAYEDPFLLAGVDAAVFGAAAPGPSRAEAVAAYLPYVEAQRAAGTPLPPLVKPLIGLVRGAHGGRAWRRALSEGCVRAGAGPELIAHAFAALPEAVRASRPDRPDVASWGGEAAGGAANGAVGAGRRLVDSRA